MGKKTGFNLIEIAIVLAVIGLVIGGIYVAASAVTENNRRQTSQKQILQIIQNVRNAYGSQSTIGVPSYAEIKATGVMPGDMADTGSAFLNAYGYPVSFSGTSFYTGTSNVVYLSFPMSHDACVDTLIKLFGSLQNSRNLGIIEAGTGSGGTAGITAGAGVTPAKATTVCDQTGINYVDIYFLLHS